MWWFWSARRYYQLLLILFCLKRWENHLFLYFSELESSSLQFATSLYCLIIAFKTQKYKTKGLNNLISNLQFHLFVLNNLIVSLHLDISDLKNQITNLQNVTTAPHTHVASWFYHFFELNHLVWNRRDILSQAIYLFLH